MEFLAVKLQTPEGANLILGHSHFIKTIEDLYEILVTTVPGARFGLAFCEASGPCLIRAAGKDETLRESAVRNAQAVAAGHSFVIVLTNAYPINILNAVKQCQEVCTIHCATANPVEVILAVTDQGRGVMGGYWNLPEQNARVFLDLADRGRWYRTGDIVCEQPDGNLKFIGRKDRMVKRRGYRVELGEIEACLYRHANVREAAVVAVPDEREGTKIIAHLATRDERRISLIELKQFCSKQLPLYFVPDLFQFHAALPKTSTDKIDYQRLQALADDRLSGRSPER